MDIPYTVTPRPDTGLFNAKGRVWLFLASEVMLFGALFTSYILLRVGAPEFLDGLRKVIAGPADWLDADALDRHLASAVQTAAAKTLEKMRVSVPRDSGRLAQSLAIGKE